MPGSTIEELLVEFSEPLTEIEYRRRRELLLLAFQDQHNLYTWSAIEKAIRTHAIEESMLVEEWIELRAFEPAMSKLSKKRPPKLREDTNHQPGRESGLFLFRKLRRRKLLAYT